MCSEVAPADARLYGAGFKKRTPEVKNVDTYHVRGYFQHPDFMGFLEAGHEFDEVGFRYVILFRDIGERRPLLAGDF